MDDPIIKSVHKRMEKALEALRHELSGIRTGRASTSLLEHIMVEAYGSPMPLNQVATVNVAEPRLITVQPWDRSTVKAIEKAIMESDLGLNPMNDGQLIRVPLPELTEERRKELVKVVYKYGEQSRVAMRGVRRDVMDQLKKQEKAKEISQDDLRGKEKAVQEHTDTYIKLIDEVIAQKEADLMHV